MGSSAISDPFTRFGEYLGQVISSTPTRYQIQSSVPGFFTDMTHNNPARADQVREVLRIISNVANPNTSTTNPANTSTPAQSAERLEPILESFVNVKPEKASLYTFDSQGNLAPSMTGDLLCRAYRDPNKGTLFIASRKNAIANPEKLWVKFNSSGQSSENLSTTTLKESDLSFSQALALWHRE